MSISRRTTIFAAFLSLAAAALPAAACRSSGEVAAPTDSTDGADAADAADSADAAAGDTVTVYVASNGWHSAIVVPRADLPPDALPEAADFPDAAYLSYGWGDAEYFPTPQKTLAMTLRAALTPTPAVVHVAGLPADPRQVFPEDEVVALAASPSQVAALVAYLDDTFARDGADRLAASEPGLYAFSLFYPATGEFHLFNTCNTWTARGLQAAGWPVRAAGVVTAEELMTQVRPLAARPRASGEGASGAGASGEGASGEGAAAP
jgi:uncharacterized protein (TIGR02117 family)